MRLSAFVFVLVSGGAVAQLAQASSSLYEGQKVSAVSLIANPHCNLETLCPLVRESPGRPCSKRESRLRLPPFRRTSRLFIRWCSSLPVAAPEGSKCKGRSRPRLRRQEWREAQKLVQNWKSAARKTEMYLGRLESLRGRGISDSR